MSHSPTTASSPNFPLIFNNALKAYEKRTKNDLVAHPLAAQLQICDSSAAILSMLQQQVQELNKSKTTDERWSNWLEPTVNILNSLSAILGECIGLVCLVSEDRMCAHTIGCQVFSPGKVIFAGVGVLLLVRIVLMPSPRLS